MLDSTKTVSRLMSPSDRITKAMAFDLIDQVEIEEVFNQRRFVDMKDACESSNFVSSN